MPLYEYKCKKCGHLFEKIESHSASVTKKCPQCGARAERQIGAPAIQFKGSGWYVTDYAGKKSSGQSNEGSGDGSSGKSQEKSGDSKPATEKGSDKSSSKSTEKGSAVQEKK